MAHSSIVSRSSSRRDSLLILSGALAGASASALLFYRALRRRARSLAMERAGRCRLERELRDLGLRLDPPPDAPRERSGKVRPEFLERYGFRAIGTIRACFSDCGASNQREPIERERVHRPARLTNTRNGNHSIVLSNSSLCSKHH